MYTDSLKHKPMTGFPWVALYDTHVKIDLVKTKVAVRRIITII